MSCKEYSVYLTRVSPFSAGEKNKFSLWKKADVITAFFNRETLKKTKIDHSFRMLFDDEFLYINVTFLSRSSLVFSVDDPSSPWQNSHFGFYLPSADDKMMLILLGEKGELHAAADDGERSLPDIRTAVKIRKNKTSLRWEGVIGIPLRYLAKDVSNLSAFDFSVFHFRNAAEGIDKETGFATISESFPERRFYLKARCSRDTDRAAEKYAAVELYREERRNITLSLSPENAGPVYKNILGMNNSPRISNAAAMEKEKELFKKLAPVRVRHHDAALTDPGYALVDVSRIFPLFRADHNDPANYDFGPTDFCLEQIVECGAEIEFRFGESIEHSGRRFRVTPPADPGKWVAVCVNILRHYNEKWADGKEWNISYVSLWEEPDNEKLFDGPFEKYLELYNIFARQMKKAFPKVKVGGPQLMSPGKNAEPFAAYCRENDLPLDFISGTGYSRVPGFLVEKMQFLRKAADKYGYHDAELFLSEWNMAPRDWRNMTADEYLIDSTEKAAFAAAQMIVLQDAVDMAYFYLWAGRSGLWGLFHSWQKPFKIYYALTFYSEFIRKELQKIPGIISSANAGIYYRAGIDKKGNVHLLLSQFRSPAEDLTIELPAAYKSCHVKLLCDAYPAGDGVKKIKSSGKGKFLLSFEEKMFGVYLLEFKR